MLKRYFEENKWQKVGALMFVAALIVSCFNQVLIPIILLIGVGVLDLWLLWKREDTITRWIDRQFPKWVDLSIVVCVLALSWWWFGPVGFLPLCMGVIVGHLFWK